MISTTFSLSLFAAIVLSVLLVASGVRFFAVMVLDFKPDSFVVKATDYSLCFAGFGVLISATRLACEAMIGAGMISMLATMAVGAALALWPLRKRHSDSLGSVPT